MKRAYTLVEVIVTISILALIAAFIVPTYQLLLSQLQLSSATETAADQIRLAQQRTVTEQQPYGVTLVNGGTTVPLFRYDPATTGKTVIATYSLPAQVQIASASFANKTDIIFSASGAPNAAGTLVLVDLVRNRNRKVEVRPSGNVLSNTAEY